MPPARSALWRLDQLLGLVSLRVLMLTHWADDKKLPSMFLAEFETWRPNYAHSSKWMYRAFLSAILFAVIFIIGVIVTL